MGSLMSGRSVRPPKLDGRIGFHGFPTIPGNKEVPIYLDDFFTRGQDWGFPPLHPERTREEDHAYFWACLAHLSAGPAETMIVGLEDLWLESDPHIPGPSGGDPGCDAT